MVDTEKHCVVSACSGVEGNKWGSEAVANTTS